MLTTLCEKCFPDWQFFEVKTITPFTACEQCGNNDNPAHLFGGDPREKVVAQHLAMLKAHGLSKYLSSLSVDDPGSCVEIIASMILHHGARIVSIEVAAKSGEVQ